MSASLRYANAARRAEAERTAFGLLLEDADYLRLAGLDGPSSDVAVQFFRKWSESAEPPPLTLRRYDDVTALALRFFAGWADLSHIVIHDPSKGAGRRLLANVFAVLQEMAFDQVRCVGKRAAAGERSREAYGHYVMPRFGFDGDLPRAVRHRLPEQFAHFATIGELLETPEGRQYWRHHGVTLRGLAFDLSADSVSWRTLQSS